MKKIIFLILALFCTQKSFAMENKALETKQFVFFTTKTISIEDLAEEFEIKTHIIRNLGYICDDFKEDSKEFLIKNEDEPPVAMILSTIIKPNKKADNCLSIENETRLFDDHKKPTSDHNKNFLLKNGAKKLFKIFLINICDQKYFKNFVFFINSDIHKDINKIFETKACYEIDRKFCLNLSFNKQKKNKFVDFCNNLFNKVTEKITEFTNNFKEKDIESYQKENHLKDVSYNESNSFYDNIKNNISRAIEILDKDKDKKTLNDYLLFAKKTSDKRMHRAILNSCFIINDLKNIVSFQSNKKLNLPADLVSNIFSFAGAESLTGKKLLVSQKPKIQENRI